MLRRFLAVLALATVLPVLPARAATTIYTDSSNFGGWPNAVNAGEAVGPADGSSAFIPTGGWIAFQVSPTYTVANFVLEVAGITGPGTALFYVGQSNGAGWFSALNNTTVTLANGVNNISSAAQTAYCTGIGGCDIFLVQAWTGTTINLDSAADFLTASSAPEPSVWALMILGFIGVAWRLKSARGGRPSLMRAAYT